MNIQGLDYNTQREPLLLPEYGREIQRMVDYAVTIDNRDERLRCAHTIVKMMATKLTQNTDGGNIEQTLWDHLYLMSHKKLDIDWPFDVSEAEKILSKPQPLPLPKAQGPLPLRHYGRLIKEMCDKLKQMPAGPERDALAAITANQMKRDLVDWGHGSTEDERVAADLEYLTERKVKLDLKTFQFERYSGNASTETTKKKRKK